MRQPIIFMAGSFGNLELFTVPTELKAGWGRAFPLYWYEEKGYAKKFAIKTNGEANTGITSIKIYITTSPPSTNKIKAVIASATFTGTPGINQWIVFNFPEAVRITSNKLYVVVLPLGTGALHYNSENLLKNIRETTAGGHPEFPDSGGEKWKKVSGGIPPIKSVGVPLPLAGSLLKDVQLEVSSLNFLWPLDTVKTEFYDEVKLASMYCGGAISTRLGMNAKDTDKGLLVTSTSASNSFLQMGEEQLVEEASPLFPWNSTEKAYKGMELNNGVTIEGITCAEPNSREGCLFSSGQASLNINGKSLVFSICLGSTFATSSVSSLTATNVLAGYPQHVVATYDPVGTKMRIYVDSVLVAESTASGIIIPFFIRPISMVLSTASKKAKLSSGGFAGFAFTRFPEFIEFPLYYPAAIQNGGENEITGYPAEGEIELKLNPSASGTFSVGIHMPPSILMRGGRGTTELAGQDVAVYSRALSKYRIEEHFQAFRQFVIDPGHRTP
jgi:hypothetical protein